jgi:outer membrane protein assembly factor BamB
LITDEYLFTSTLKTELKQISRKSGKVIWSHTLYANKEAGRRSKTINGNDPLQYADGKLYVLDSEKTLHMLDVARD